MNRSQSGLAGALLALALLVPCGNSMADQSNNGGGDSARAAGALTLPITGSEAGGGAFNGAITINRFAMQNGHLVAVGFVRGTITNAAGVVLASGLRPVALPVTLGTGLALTSAATSGETSRMLPALFSGATGG